jgi:CBS domain-containing protein
MPPVEIKLKVSNILQSKDRKPLTVPPDTLLSHCVVTMADQDLGSLVVLAQREKVLRCGPTPPVAELKVREVMNSAPICTTADVELRDLPGLMLRKHQRYILVPEKGELIGVLSFHDVPRTVFAEQEQENRMLKSYIAG